MTYVDQLESLPSEIQDRIFNLLTFHERLRCSTVCSSWRSLVLNSPVMWRKLSTVDGHNIAPNLMAYKDYIQGPCVKYVCVDDNNRRKSIALAKVVDFLSERGCRSIEHVEFSVNRVINTSFLDIASLCSNRLTRVTLTVMRYLPHPITLDQILLRCPNLRKLYFVTLPWQKVQDPTPLIDFKQQNLVDLALYVHDLQTLLPVLDIGQYTFDLSPYLKSTPKLQRLCLGYTNGTGAPPLSLLSVLRQYCPSMSCLYISKGIEGVLHADTDLPMQQTPVGLMELGLLNLSGGTPETNIIRHIISESHERLQVLELKRLSVFSQQDAFEFLSTFVFPSLNRLVISGRCAMTPPRSLCNFLARSVPNLVSLKINIYECLKADDILQAISANIKHLEHVVLDDAYPSFSSSQLTRFFDTMADGQLRTITLRNVQNLTAQVLHHIITQHLDVSEIVIVPPDDALVQELITFLSDWSLGRRVNKLYIHVYQMKSRSPHLSDQDYIMQFLAFMDKFAKQWTFETKFPDRWTIGKEPIKKSRYDARRGTIGHTIYREHVRRQQMYC